MIDTELQEAFNDRCQACHICEYYVDKDTPCNRVEINILDGNYPFKDCDSAMNTLKINKGNK